MIVIGDFIYFKSQTRIVLSLEDDTMNVPTVEKVAVFTALQ